MSQRLPLLFAAALFLSLGCASAQAQSPRVSTAYTTWDDYYFYAGVQVSDPNVISMNRSPVSQPQQDDDVEVFFETDGPEQATVRTDKTYQMAVSAGNGAYFSQGDGTKIPKARMVLTYKYAATVDGTLNKLQDKDVGYTVELAIPWVELGLSGPPAPGTTWGFNLISRDRSSMDAQADKLVSLSPLVQSGADVQDPSKWTKIEFVDTIASMHSTTDVVYCPKVRYQYPVIDGVLRSGEWPEMDGFSFGATEISAPAPATADEPNIQQSPLSAAMVGLPSSGASAPPKTQADNSGYDVLLPGGGTLHVGKRPILPTAPPEEEPLPPSVPKHKHGKKSPTQVAQVPEGSDENPLAINGLGPLSKPLGPDIDTSTPLSLTAEAQVTPLLLAPFALSTTSQTPLSALHDQPMDAQGAWFGGLSVGWVKDQVADARRAGVDVLLPTYEPRDPNAKAKIFTLVEAIKELQAEGSDYPLLGLRLPSGVGYDAVHDFFSLVPADLRAEIALPDSADNQQAYIVMADSTDNAAALSASFAADFAGHGLLVTTPEGSDTVKVACVCPGGIESGDTPTPRALAQTYQQSWQDATGANPDWILLISWNDYANGTEVAASRQYGEQYADLTRVLSLQWSGQQEWRTRYLQSAYPTTIAPHTLYTATVRVENAGSLPWRVGEGYSLCYRWYKDGRLYDDSAPRIPLTEDVYPGQSATVGVGILAQNAYGGAIEPGDYVLVFDMVQGQDRWFTYAGDNPLKVHVKVLADTDPVPNYQMQVLATSTPPSLQAGAPYNVTVTLRNAGGQLWKAGTVVAASRFPEDAGAKSPVGKAALAEDIAPGSIAQVSVPIKVDGAPGDTNAIAWSVQPTGAAPVADLANLDQVTLVPGDFGATFALSEVPRHLRTGDKATAQLGLINNGPTTWPAGATKVGYHWAYLDGTPAGDGTDLTPISTAVAPGRGATVSATFHAPLYPGRYNLTWDVKLASGAWASQGAYSGQSLVAQVWVSDGRDSRALPVDLSRDFNAGGIGFESSSSDADFDGSGDSIPGEMLPPDGTGEVNGNPLLIGAPGPAYYPSGYYSQATGEQWQSNHRISFLYPEKRGMDVIACHGQVIDLPDGRYTALHLLGAATTGGEPASASFGLIYDGGSDTATLSVADWGKPVPAGATVGYQCSYRLGRQGIDSGAPCVLGDYAIPLDSSKRLLRLQLPNAPGIKILAVTLER